MTMRISFSGKGADIKGSIKYEGNTTFIQSCLASVITEVAAKYQVTPDRVLQDIWQVIQLENQSQEKQNEQEERREAP